MSETTEKLAALNKKAETGTDYWLTKLVAFPYSWIPWAVIVLLAAYGALRLVV